MAIKLSNLTFIDEDDIVSAFGVEKILNTEVPNTLAGDDIIAGTSNDYGFEDVGILNTDDNNDTITSLESLQPEFDSSYGIVNSGTFNADEDNDILTGISKDDSIVNFGRLNTDENNDILTGTTSSNDFRRSGGRFNSRRLIIDMIKCLKNGADSIGPDDTYIKINGRRIWGDYNMIKGQSRSVVQSIIYQDSAPPRVELFDKDAIGKDDFMGGFTAGEYTSFYAQGFIQQVRGCGSIYDVYYRFSYP